MGDGGGVSDLSAYLCVSGHETDTPTNRRGGGGWKHSQGEHGNDIHRWKNGVGKKIKRYAKNEASGSCTAETGFISGEVVGVANVFFLDY